MINSKQKGNRGERLLAEELRNNGFKARRGQQFSGSPESPDVICQELLIHWECKFTEKLNIYKAMDQSIDDCPSNSIPVVAHKKNRSDWHVTLTLHDFLVIIKNGARNVYNGV